MTEEAFNQLLLDTKNELDITWQDDDTDKKLTGIIKRGLAYIDNVAGAVQDYTIEAEARGLLFDYCRYVRAGANVRCVFVVIAFKVFSIFGNIIKFS